MSDPRPPFDRVRAGWLRVAARLREQRAALLAAAERLRREGATDPRLHGLAAEIEDKARRVEAELERAGAMAERIGRASAAAGRTWIETFRSSGDPPAR